MGLRIGGTGRGRGLDTSRDAVIAGAALDLLVENGYDRLTMDAVAARARAGKATLYRRWSSKADLVVDALLALEETPCAGEDDVDTGSLRGDLVAMSCGAGGYTDPGRVQLMAAMATALCHDPELARIFRERFIAPRAERLRRCVERARARGEVADGTDAELVLTAIPAIAVFCSLFGTRPPDEDLVIRVVDAVVLPALAAAPQIPRTAATT